MPSSSKRWRSIAYGIGITYVLSFVVLVCSYEWLRLKGARSPNPNTGETIARRMQQPFDVYLTKFEVSCLDWAPVILLALLAVGLWAQRRWKKEQGMAQDVRT